MREVKGNIWSYPIVVITTNGDVNRFGEAVMGRGTALQAKSKYLDIAKELGGWLVEHGNIPRCFVYEDRIIFTLPVKHHWYEKADLGLIEQSIKILVTKIDVWGIEEVALPRPGCGNGKLNWKEVCPVIEPYLDDRFVVVNNG